MAQTPSVDPRVPLAIEGLSIVYGERRAVDTLSLSVRPGEIYGLLGSNGAGKSSTIKAIVGLVRPAAGRVRVFGTDPWIDGLAAKARIGYVPETSLLYEALTPREFLEFVASVRGLPADAVSERLRTYAAAFRLDDEMEEPILTLSNGTRQKVLLLAALLHQPPLLVLDEPLHSLDPRSVRIVKELLARYVADGARGVLFSTHTMEVAQQLCGRVGILDHGVLRAEGSLAALRERSARGDASLEEVFLRLTEEEASVAEAVRSLERPADS
ncbi:MAG TPA: ABC transporter ATP-binding protein [Thermoplasmata archaeon]|nr:ABC transporter ATP-binding protein [Thermoplasmata archaeon]